MPTPGYNSTLKSSGTPTAMVNEATSELTADTIFQITNSARRIIDPDAAVVVRVNGVIVTTGFTLDYLLGKATFSPPLNPADVVTISGNYLPMFDLLEGKEFNIDLSRDLNDSTVFKATPNRTRQPCLKDASGSISVLSNLLDASGGIPVLFDLLSNGTRFVLEITPGGTTKVFRAWVRFESQQVAAAVADLVNATLNWQLVTSENSLASFVFDTP